MNTVDFTIIGGGIVGVATAWQLQMQFPEAAIIVVEKDSLLGWHQTGHNSGVIHAGVYYQPGSLKADFCKRGATRTYSFCREYNLPVSRCGKLLVATNEVEYGRMAGLETRCRQNGIEIHRWSEAELVRQEPRITGVGALWVPTTGITDYRRISSKIAELFIDMGGRVNLGTAVSELTESKNDVQFRLGQERYSTRYLIACGGLMADRIAAMMNIDIDFRIIPFRGEYYQLGARHDKIVNRLIYPIPDPKLPFLGVHLTRMINGSVTVGPNAVLGWKREGYGALNFDVKDTMEMVTFRGFWKVLKANLKTGAGEIKDSLHKRGYLKRVQKYCPSLTIDDLQPYPAGIRAQAVKSDGTLVHDFLFAETHRSLHVCNAPSPAATSAIPIGSYITDKVKTKFKL